MTHIESAQIQQARENLIRQHRSASERCKHVFHETERVFLLTRHRCCKCGLKVETILGIVTKTEPMVENMFMLLPVSNHTCAGEYK